MEPDQPVSANTSGSVTSRRMDGVTCTWMQPSPNQQHIAICWRAAGEGNCRPKRCLCIYSVDSAQPVANVDVEPVGGCLYVEQHQPQWSPNSSSILFPEQQMHALSPGVLVADVTGSHRLLPATASRQEQIASGQQTANISTSMPESPELARLTSHSLVGLCGMQTQAGRFFPGRNLLTHALLSGDQWVLLSSCPTP